MHNVQNWLTRNLLKTKTIKYSFWFFKEFPERISTAKRKEKRKKKSVGKSFYWLRFGVLFCKRSELLKIGML